MNLEAAEAKVEQAKRDGDEETLESAIRAVSLALLQVKLTTDELLKAANRTQLVYY